MPTSAEGRLDGTTSFSAYQKIIALQKREWSAGDRFNRYYRELTQSYKQELEDAFYRYFVYPVDQRPHWDAFASVRHEVAKTLDDQFTELLTDLEEEVDTVSEEELEEAFLQGWYYGLWDVYQAGHEVGDVDPPDAEAIAVAIAGVAIGGMGLMQRAKRWMGEASLKHKTGIRAVTSGEFTLPDTILWFEGIESFLQQRVSGLLENEIHRAFELGQRMAVLSFSNLLIGEVWVTRMDTAVCPFCAKLHMTITELKPIEDSHPGCRCFKIPLLEGAGKRPIDFKLFLAELTAE